MENNELKINRDLHQESWKGVWYILKRRETFRKFPFVSSLILSFCLVLFLILNDFNNSFTILTETANLIVSIFPDMLGFILGGFAIVVGFSNVELIKKGTSLSKPSIYQILNAIFAYCTIIQVIILVIAFVVSWCIKINFWEVAQIESEALCNSTNFFLIFILAFGTLFSLLLLPIIIVNLFTLSQLNNLFYTMEERVIGKKQDVGIEEETKN